MNQTIFSKINQALNLHPSEWPRVSIAWIVNFFYRTGFIIGWTILLSMFLSQMGLNQLPWLFIVNAGLIIVGTLIYAQVIERIKKEFMIIFTTVSAGVLLYFSTLFVGYNEIFFFGLLLIGQSILVSQLGILISIFNEDLFSPLESQRTFPIIESAETIGGIIGGTILGFFGQRIATFKFVYIWVILLFAISVALLIFINYAKKIPFLQQRKDINKEKIPISAFENLKNINHNLRRVPFIKGLVFLVLAQWMFVNLLEFQYTKAIQSHINGQENKSIVLNIGSNLKTDILDNHLQPVIKGNLKSATPINTYEKDLTRDLGKLHIIFSAAALLVQLFLASRVIKSLGIIGSMILYPIVLFINLLILSFRFTFLSAITTKTSFEIVNTIHKNAYHSSYYALHGQLREQAKEFSEGIAKPIGAIIGMIGIIILRKLFIGETLNFSINALMAFILGMIFIAILQLQKQYTNLAKNHLKQAGNHSSKFNAIEILSQKGHRNAIRSLIELLHLPEESIEIKIKILQAFGEIKDYSSIPDILDCLEDGSEQVRKAALESLNKFPQLDEQFFNHAFSRHRTIEILKTLFARETSEENQALIIKIMAHFKQIEIVDFILNTLKNNPSQTVKAHCIYACGLFHDPNTAYYLKPYLVHPHGKIRGTTIVALWQFPRYQKELNEKLDEMIKSPEISLQIAACEAIGDLKIKHYVSALEGLSKQPESTELQLASIIALAKLNKSDVIYKLIEILFQSDEKLKAKIQKAIPTLPKNIQQKIHTITHQNVCNHINQLISEHSHASLEEAPLEFLHKLKKAYSLINAKDELLKIEDIMKERQKNNFPIASSMILLTN